MYSNNLYEARKQARKTQAELAEMLAMNTIVYGRYERGERDIPLSVAVQMADVLNVSLDYLAGRSRIASGTKSDDEFLQKTLIDPAMKNVTSEKDALYAYVNVLREEQRKTNEKTENAVAQIMKIINDKYPSE
ncbi:MAG: helix-turn-helix domain-containing protein [Ruminococcus sp.]|jgi:hypothetical protein|nr:helix-turn-helix domain-containing protein [Ruminococcus sp.]